MRSGGQILPCQSYYPLNINKLNIIFLKVCYAEYVLIASQTMQTLIRQQGREDRIWSLTPFPAHLHVIFGRGVQMMEERTTYS